MMTSIFGLLRRERGSPINENPIGHTIENISGARAAVRSVRGSKPYAYLREWVRLTI